MLALATNIAGPRCWPPPWSCCVYRRQLGPGGPTKRSRRSCFRPRIGASPVTTGFPLRRRRHLHRHSLASDDDGEFRAGSLLAGGRSPRIHRSCRVQGGDRRRVLEVPHADGALPVQFEGQRRRGLLAPDVRLRRSDGLLAQDGVSCSLCHQITKDKLGTRESLVGGFVIDTTKRAGEREEYGPFKIENGENRIMRTSSGGYRPTEGEHIRQSELCATCHTLITDGAGTRRPEDRRASRTDAVSGMARQRIQGQAELPELPHAGR